MACVVSSRGQIDRRCSLSDLAVRLHRSAGLACKTIDLRQTEPGSFADLLGREKRIEHLGQKIRRNTNTRVAKRYRNKRSIVADFLFHHRIVDGQRERAAAQHCVAGVNGDIDNRELQLPTRRTMASSLGKMPTTSVRRLIS